MKQVCFFVIFLLVGSWIFGQSCFPIGVSFIYQSQVDSFSIHNPGCNRIEGDLNILGSEIKNLDGLLNIVSIGGSLKISSDSLIDLSGLNNLESIGENLTIRNNNLFAINEFSKLSTIGRNLSIDENNNLLEIDGFAKLDTIEGSMYIMYNNNLSHFTGMNQLAFTGGCIAIDFNDRLTNIEGMASLYTITGTLNVRNNSNLISFTGLNNIYSTGGLVITRNQKLTNLLGFENLSIVKGHLGIIENKNLISLNAFNNLSTIEEGLSIQSNEKLKNLDGFENLSYTETLLIWSNPIITGLPEFENLSKVHNLFIWQNQALKELEGLWNLEIVEGQLMLLANLNLSNISELENISSIGGKLQIQDNSKLSTCEIYSICQHLSNPNNLFEIQNNGFGCNSKSEIINSCNDIGKLIFDIFLDQNRNGIQEFNELSVPNIPILVQPIDKTIFSISPNQDEYFFKVGNYSAFFNDTLNWNLTTADSQKFTIQNRIPDTVSFGIYPKVIISELKTIINSDHLRCGETVKFNVALNNLGTTVENGTLWFDIDNRLFDFTLNADIVNGNTLGWNFQDLHPGHEFVKEVNIQIPTPPVIPVGEILKFKSYFDNGENEFEYNVEVRCAYDPNDKLVTPDRSAEYQGTAYTKFDEDLFYTVRFQNTGNDVAYDVVIRDTLDANLDPSTFKIISSSHFESLNVSMEDERNLTFEFKDIFLPDSSTNFDASNGYVSYLIKTKDGLPEETLIQNTASIYFDFNPPVVTNTTENVMVTELPTSSTDDKNQQLDIHLFPNPTDGKIYLSGIDLRAADISVYDLTGRLILIEKSGSNEITLPETASGMLFLKIETEEGAAVKRVFKNN